MADDFDWESAQPVSATSAPQGADDFDGESAQPVGEAKQEPSPKPMSLKDQLFNRETASGDVAKEAWKAANNGQYGSHLLGGINSLVNGMTMGYGPQIDGQLESLLMGKNSSDVANASQSSLDAYKKQYPASAEGGDMTGRAITGAAGAGIGGTAGTAMLGTKLGAGLAKMLGLGETLRGGKDIKDVAGYAPGIATSLMTLLGQGGQQ